MILLPYHVLILSFSFLAVIHIDPNPHNQQYSVLQFMLTQTQISSNILPYAIKSISCVSLPYESYTIYSDVFLYYDILEFSLLKYMHASVKPTRFFIMFTHKFYTKVLSALRKIELYYMALFNVSCFQSNKTI